MLAARMHAAAVTVTHADLVGVGEAELGQHAAGDQQADAVARGVVGQAHREPVVGQLMGVGSRHDDVAGDGGIHDLAGDVLVAESHDEAVFVRVVFVLVLLGQAQASAVVGLACEARRLAISGETARAHNLSHPGDGAGT